MNRAGWLLLVVSWTACSEEEAKPIEIPSAVHGLFGRAAEDLENGTRGLEVDATSMRFSEMTMVVTDGKMVGDTFQIGRAEVRWKKDDAGKLPKECKGTLARQGDRLLVTLFKKDTDEPCESILKGEWTQWTEVTEMPAWARGVYGRSDPYSATPTVTIDAKGMQGPDSDARVELVTAYQFVDQERSLFVTAAKYEDTTCRGGLSLEGGALDLTLANAAEDGQPSDGWCPFYDGTRWAVDVNQIPKAALSNGKVTASFDGDQVTLTNQDSPAFTCVQKVIRTSSRSTTDKSMDNLTVLSGQVLTLAPAAPTSGKDSCGARMKNLLTQRCTELGVVCDAEDLSDTDVPCPTHLVVGDPTGPGRKLALLPNDVKTVACYDMTGEFQGK